MISVTIAHEPQLHLANEERGMGWSAYTLCLRKWTKREPCREGDEFCPECLERFKEESDGRCDQ